MIKNKKNDEDIIKHDDIDKRPVKKDLLDNAERLKEIMMSAGDGIIITDKFGNIEFLNPVAEKFTGWTSFEAAGKHFDEVVNLVDEYTGKKCESIVKRVFESGETVELDNYNLLISKFGFERFIEDRATPLLKSNGTIDGVVLIIRDFTDKRERLAKIEYLSYHDQLTGLYNRRFYEEELKRIDTKRNLPITLVIGDINGLKLTNDAFGHLVGDKLLKRVADVMKKECREDDIIVRLGGDEFVLLLPKTNYCDAGSIVQRINERISMENVDSIKLSISFGWETKYSETEKMIEVFRRAENSMYKNKLIESEEMKSYTVQVIMQTLYENISTEQNHSESVSKLCRSIGNALGLSDEKVEELRILGVVHDIGKIAVGAYLFNLPRALEEWEWIEVKQHMGIGYRILRLVKEYSKIAEAVLAHHERWDGSGYPKGLKGEEIPFNSRILAIADSYDAMISVRPYRKPFNREQVVSELKNNAGKQFDPELTKVFIEKVLCESW